MQSDPVTRILCHAEALRALAGLLPDDQCGVSMILGLLSLDLKACGEKLDPMVPPAPGRPEARAKAELS